MKTLYFDCQAGISGDMTVAALLDLGVPMEHLQGELQKLALPNRSYELSIARTERHHIFALKFDVELHDHQTHRHYDEIDAMIAESLLSEGVKEKARCIFRCLAEAEAKVHNVPIAEVHFHEVGAIDSIIDIVGTAICLEYLGVGEVHVSSLPWGSGFVETAHGRLPVPAPATAELLKGVPVHGDTGLGERVTPTGAAIVKALAAGFGSMPSMTISAIGHGAGGKDFPDRPNILRLFLGETTSLSPGTEVQVIETHIDDMSPEIAGFLMERLFEAGALDVAFSPIQMKKNRPGLRLTVLSPTERIDELARLIVTESTAIGVRYYPASRLVLERRIETRETSLGTVRVKVVSNRVGIVRITPEFEDCRRLALEQGMPLLDLYKLVDREAGQR